MKRKINSGILRAFKALTLFRLHFGVYLAVMVLLWIIWAVKGSSAIPWRFIYPAGAWALVLLAHFIVVYRILQPRRKE